MISALRMLVPLLAMLTATTTFAGAQFTGRIVDSAGASLPGTTVILGRQVDTLASRFKFDSAQTDDSGYYNLGFEPTPGDDGVYFLEARRPAYHSQELRLEYSHRALTGSIPIGASAMLPDSVAVSGHVVKATVLRPDGITPAPNVRVGIGCLYEMLGTTAYPDYRVTTSDANGNVDVVFPFFGFRDCVGLSIQADAEGGLGASDRPHADADMPALRARLESGDILILQPQGTVTGTVRDAGGTPMPDYPLRLSFFVRGPGHGLTDFLYQNVGTARTDANGVYTLTPRRTLPYNYGCRIDVPRPDSLSISCPYPGMQVKKDITLQGGDSVPAYDMTPVRVLGRAADPEAKKTIQGNLVSITGAPVAGALVVIIDESGNIDSTRTGATGSYSLSTSTLRRGFFRIRTMEARKETYLTLEMDYRRLASTDPYASGFDLGTNILLKEPLPKGYRKFALKVLPGSYPGSVAGIGVSLGCLLTDSALQHTSVIADLNTVTGDGGALELAYRYPGIPPRLECDRPILVVNAPGYGALDTLTSLEKFSVGDTVTLTSQGTIYGKLVDSVGAAAPDHALALRTGPSNSNFYTTLGKATTDSAGNYALTMTQAAYPAKACHIDYSFRGTLDIPCPALGEKIRMDINLTTGPIFLRYPGPANPFRFRREASSRGTLRWTVDIPYGDCRIRILETDGRVLFDRVLSRGIQNLELDTAGAGRMLLVQWSLPPKGGCFKLPAF